MPDLPYRSAAKKSSAHNKQDKHDAEDARQDSPRKDSKELAAEEALRDQARTETEERPYLDTEGSD